MDPIEWITHHLDLQPGTTDKLLYDDMESQSGKSLPWIYLPFDPNRPGHGTTPTMRSIAHT